MATFCVYWQDTADVQWQDTADVQWVDWCIEIAEIPPVLDVAISVLGYDVSIGVTDYDVEISLE